MCKLAEGSKLAVRVEAPTVGGLLQQLRDECGGEVQMVLLGSFCEISTGKTIVKEAACEDGLYPIISGGKDPMGFCNVKNRTGKMIKWFQNIFIMH